MSTDSAKSCRTVGVSSQLLKPTTLHHSESDEQIEYPPALVTPKSCQVSSPDAVTPPALEPSTENPEPLELSSTTLEQARWDAEQSAQALEHMVGGIRAVKRMLEKTAADDHPNVEDYTTDLQHIHEISEELHGVLGSNLMALVNAAEMIREHSKLASRESSDLMADLNKSKLQAQASSVKAKEATKIGRKLFKENLELKDQIHQLGQEKRLLVSEVKSLRDEVAETRKYDSWRLLEQHMLGSMAIHEMVMKTPTTPKLNIFKEDAYPTGPANNRASYKSDETQDCWSQTTAAEVVTPRESSGLKGGLATLRGAFRYRRGSSRNLQNSSRSDHGCNGIDTDTISSPRMHTKSPIPSLGEVSSYTDDSDTKETKTEDRSTQTTAPPDRAIEITNDRTFPGNVAFDPKSGPNSQNLTSPLMSPEGSPDGIALPDYKPICDPHILRTLAIPSSKSRSNSPSPRHRVSASPTNLYEC